MPLTLNLRHLETQDLHLTGELAAEELDIETGDEVLQTALPLTYDIVVQQLEESILAQGSLKLPLQCQCVRCLKPFQSFLELPSWALHLPLTGEDAVTVINDCVDLTPYVREDILLELPRHPLCDPECRGLPATLTGKPKKAESARQVESSSSAWAELNKLKL
jgi:uncharacterized protein